MREVIVLQDHCCGTEECGEVGSKDVYWCVPLVGFHDERPTGPYATMAWDENEGYYVFWCGTRNNVEVSFFPTSALVRVDRIED